MSDVCQNPESINNNYYRHIGYHQECHKRLTIHVSQLKSTAKIAIKRPVRTPSSKILFLPECIFCGKFESKNGGKTYRSKHFTFHSKSDGALKESWKIIKQKSKDMNRNDLYCKISG